MKLIKYLIFLILFLFPFGQLTRLPLGIAEVNIYLQDILIVLLVISWLVWHRVRRKPFIKPALFFPIILFFLIGLLSLSINFFSFTFREIFVASLYLLRWLFYAGVYFVVYEMRLLRCIDTSKWRWGLVLAGMTAAIFGLFQYFLYPDLRNLEYLGWDPHKYRIFGTFLDPGFLGIILVLTLILLVEYLFKNKKIYYLLFTLCYLALALTYSRSSYLAYLAGMGMIALLKKSWRFFLLVVLLGVATIVVLPRPPESLGVKLEREETILARIKNWQQSLIIFKDKPILGVGFNTYRYAQKKYGFLTDEGWLENHAGAGADSSLLFVLATTGILGFSAYTYMAYKTYKNLVIISSLVALFVHSWFANSLFYPWIMLWLWMLLGSISGKQTIPRSLH